MSKQTIRMKELEEKALELYLEAVGWGEVMGMLSEEEWKEYEELMK